jgi:hypothetical protein
VFALCAIGSIGALIGRGEGVTTPGQDSKPYAAIGGRGLLEIQAVGPLALHIGLDGMATATQITLRMSNVDVWTTPLFSAGVSAGCAMTF